MKIGILTFHRAHNYGAVLQCYALQSTLKSMGHEAYVIDYRQPHLERHYSVLNWQTLVTNAIHFHPRNVLKIIKSIRRNKKRQKLFADFLDKNIQLTERCQQHTIPTTFDVYVIGSDQLWSKHCLGGRWDPVYLGQFPHNNTSRIISYAISSNDSSVEELLREKTQELATFHHISMRESKYADIISRRLSKDITVDIDPVLLASPDSWQPLLNKAFEGKHFVAQCLYREWRVHKPAIDSFVGKHNLETVSLTGNNLPVPDFVSSIYFADCVLSTSFHTIVFAIIFHKPFVYLRLNDGQDERCENLLSLVGLNDLTYESGEINIERDIDWESVDKKLQTLRNKSINNLNNYIK